MIVLKILGLRFSLIVLLAVVFLLAAEAEEYHFISSWGDQRPDLVKQLNIPRGVAVDSLSNVYVSDTYNNRIIKYNSDGQIQWIKEKNDCNGNSINYPMEMAVDKYDRLYVVEMLNNWVSIFDSSGNCQRIITGNFKYPIGVTVDDYLNIYVTDRRNNVIKKFDSYGNLLSTWTGFSGPWGIVFHEGHIFVTQSGGNKQIKKLDTYGNIIKEWGSYGIGNGQFMMAEGIAAHNDRLYVADGEYSRIHVFDLDGNFIEIIGERGTGEGQLQFSTALAIDKNNQWLYVSDDDNSRIVKFDISPSNYGRYLTQWGCDSSGNTRVRYPTKIAVDNVNNVLYVADSGNHKIRKLNLDMQEISSWGEYGSYDGQFKFPIDIAVDSIGNVYVVDNAKRDVQKFDPDGNFIAKWDINFDAKIYLYGLHSVTVDSNDYIYVVNADSQKLYRLDPQGNKLDAMDIDYYPTGVEIDERNGFIYISKFDVNRPEADTVKRYPTGEVIGKGNLFHPWDVVVDDMGNIYVPDFNHGVSKFDIQGNLKVRLGSNSVYNPGIGWGEFDLPYGVAVDKKGYLYVADTRNHRIQKFARVLFNDVPATYWALPFINKIYDTGITSGCSTSSFCPENFVTRAQMAVFITKALGESPSATCTGTVFNDVNASTVGDGFCKYIEKFASLGITSGCQADDPNTPQNEARYCPNNNVTRAQMAVFITKALGESPSATCTGTVFNDVNASTVGDGFCKYIEKFASLSITSGCQADDPNTPQNEARYCPNNNVTRAQMAVFLTKGFLQ